MRLLITGLALAAVLVGCSEQSSLSIENRAAAPFVVRVYFNDFDESFGFDVPAGSDAWAWAPLEGRVSGPVAVYDLDCRLLSTQTLPKVGGHLVLVDAGALSLADGGANAPSSYLEFTERCAEVGNPRRRPVVGGETGSAPP